MVQEASLGTETIGQDLINSLVNDCNKIMTDATTASNIIRTSRKKKTLVKKKLKSHGLTLILK